MVITPSATGSIGSGAAFWCIVHSTIAHIESLPIIGRLLNKEKIYNWTNKNKVMALTGTEIVNFSIHGITNPLGVMAAVGGTAVNTIMICGYIPFRQRRKAKRDAVGMILGRA